MKKPIAIPAFFSALALLLLVSSCARMPSYAEAPREGGEARVPLSALSEGLPVFYSYVKEGGRVNFFVVLRDNEARSYLDACAKCGPKKKGFRVSGEKLLCNACGVGHPLDALDGVGSCHPLPLKGALRDGYYAIQEKELEKALRHF
jgi:uncharacterized membrane protein